MELSRAPTEVVVLGGGPAGIRLAGQLSARKIRTVLLEKALFLETRKTWALPDTIVDRYGLQASVRLCHRDTYFRDYFGLNFPSEIGYCIMDQMRALSQLAGGIDWDYCTVIENCACTAYERLPEGRLKAKAMIDDFRLVRWSRARRECPRSLAGLELDRSFYEAQDPLVLVDYNRALDAPGKLWPNPSFSTRLLVDAGGFRSNLGLSFHRQRRVTVWKCLVYEFEGLKAQPRQIIWDLSMPTETSANFWVDVSGPRSAAVGVMVLGETTPENPESQPSRALMAEHMHAWLNIQGISGRLVRERYGYIPMTDFKEPAAHDQILFIGASATRQVPDTGFGFYCALEEADLAAPILERALAEGRLSRDSLVAYDLEWLKRCEFSMALNKVFQNFHLASLRDEYFHDFAALCTTLPSGIIKRRLANELTDRDLRRIALAVARQTGVISRDRLDPRLFEPLLDDLALFLYCLASRLLGVYLPQGSPMFRHGGLPGPFAARCWVSLRVAVLRRFPTWCLKQACRLLFTPVGLRILRLFAGKNAPPKGKEP
jgi:flavin-dependent dehydrogenase